VASHSFSTVENKSVSSKKIRNKNMQADTVVVEQSEVVKVVTAQPQTATNVIISAHLFGMFFFKRQCLLWSGINKLLAMV
jgi:hypothetical protein